MEKAQKIELVTTLVKHYEDFSAALDKMRPYIDLTGSGISNLYFSLFETASKLASDEIKDDWQWLEWFIYDNNCGKRGLEAGEAGTKLKPIKTPEDLINFLEKTKEQT